MNNLKENLNNIRSRVDFACQKAGRDPREVRILAVSKRHPADKIRAIGALGVDSFGENYVKEAVEKIERLQSCKLEWHFIGPVQSNKTREIASHFQWVQSVDREKILHRLASQRPAALPALNICIQVNIDDEPQKSGCSPALAAALARQADSLQGLRLRGLMCIPRMGSADHDPAESYRRMHELFKTLCKSGLNMDTLSMGMSADLEQAICHGSTMVRIGTDLFGPRPPLED